MSKSRLLITWEPESMRKQVRKRLLRETQGNLGKVLNLFVIIILSVHPHATSTPVLVRLGLEP